MRASELFVLAGQVVQIVAGFILSADVIGLGRLAKWSRALKAFKFELLTNDEKGSRSRYKSGKALVEYAICLVVIIFLIVVAKFVTVRFESEVGELFRLSPWVFGLPFALVGIGLLWCLYRVLIGGLHLAIRGLITLENRTRKRTIGVVGFLLLFVGFALQFGGTLAQALLKSGSSP